jgi:hypothetical protein
MILKLHLVLIEGFRGYSHCDTHFRVVKRVLLQEIEFIHGENYFCLLFLISTDFSAASRIFDATFESTDDSYFREISLLTDFNAIYLKSLESQFEK